MMKKPLFAAMIVATTMVVAPVYAADWTWDTGDDAYVTLAQHQVLEALPAELAAYAKEHPEFVNERTGTLYGSWQWAVAPERLSVWISNHCARFLRKMGLVNPTRTAQCITTVYATNAAMTGTIRDPGDVNVGDRWLLPSLDVDPAVVQAHFADAARAEDAAKRLAQPITLGEAQQLLASFTSNFNSTVSGQIETAVLNIFTSRGAELVTDDMIKTAITAVLIERGNEFGFATSLDLTDGLKDVNDRIDNFVTRLERVEKAQQDAELDQHRANVATMERLMSELGMLDSALAGDDVGVSEAVRDVLVARAAKLRTVLNAVQTKVDMGQAPDRVITVERELSAAGDDLSGLQTQLASAQAVPAAVDVRLTELGLTTTDDAGEPVINKSASYSFFGLFEIPNNWVAPILMVLGLMASVLFLRYEAIATIVGQKDRRAGILAFIGLGKSTGKSTGLIKEVGDVGMQVTAMGKELDAVTDTVYTDRFAISDRQLDAVNTLGDGESISFPAKPLGVGANAESFTVTVAKQADEKLAFTVNELPSGGNNLWHAGVGGFTKKQLGAAGGRFVNHVLNERAAAKRAAAAATTAPAPSGAPAPAVSTGALVQPSTSTSAGTPVSA